MQAKCVVIASDVGCTSVWIDLLTSKTPYYCVCNFLLDLGIHSLKSFSVIVCTNRKDLNHFIYSSGRWPVILDRPVQVFNHLWRRVPPPPPKVHYSVLLQLLMLKIRSPVIGLLSARALAEVPFVSSLFVYNCRWFTRDFMLSCLVGVVKCDVKTSHCYIIFVIVNSRGNTSCDVIMSGDVCCDVKMRLCWKERCSIFGGS